MADLITQVPIPNAPMVMQKTGVPVKAWFDFFTTLWLRTGGSTPDASIALDTLGSTRGGMLARFATSWLEFEATVANTVPVMNPGGATDVQLFTISQLLDLIGLAQGDVLFRGAAGWKALAPVANKFFMSKGAGVDAVFADVWLPAKSFGAIGDGVIDDTVALQNWITAGQNTGQICFLNPGTYKITSALSVTTTVTILGAGFNQSILQPAVNIDGIDVLTTLAVEFHDFGISYPSAASGGTTAISVSAGVGVMNSSSVFRNLQIINANYGIQFLQAQAWIVDGCKISLFVTAGVLVQNSVNVDAGDSTMVNNYLLAVNSSATTCVQWVSSGGFRFVNNKCLTAANGLIIQLASAAVTAQMTIVGNSFDGMTGSAFSAVRQAATGTFARIVFNANICNGCLVGVQVPADASGAWLTSLTIVGNCYIGTNSASAKFVNLASLTSFVVANNSAESQNASSVLITTAASVTSGIVGPNIKTGTWAANSIAGTTVTTIAPN